MDKTISHFLGQDVQFGPTPDELKAIADYTRARLESKPLNAVTEPTADTLALKAAKGR